MIPYTTEPRRDTGVTNVTLGIWLFLASEVMLFGSLFSAYALLRASATSWPSGVLSPVLALVNTVVLAVATAAVWRARTIGFERVTTWLAVSTFCAFLFTVLKGAEYRQEMIAGLVPSASSFLALYFTLTGLHAMHVIVGGFANAWAIVGATRGRLELTDGRVRALSLYWVFVEVVWLVILVLFYVT
jgi:heme/copper-type cytochrome/quinol oxidase subunit 3